MLYTMYIYFCSQNFGYSMNTHASIAGSPLPAGGRKRSSGTLGADAGELLQALVGDARHGRRQAGLTARCGRRRGSREGGRQEGTVAREDCRREARVSA